MQENTIGAFLITMITVIIITVIGGLFWALPTYNVWTKEMKGKAQLREAEWSKQIAIEEARALKESAVLKAEAEVERAKGVSQANEIIGSSLSGNEEYLRYLYIDQLSTTQNQIIYIPTEAGLPLLEARNR